MKIYSSDELPESKYHEIQAFSNSGIRHLIESPAHYKASLQPKSTVSNQPVDAKRLGSAVHSIVLENKKPIVFKETVSLASKAAREFVAAHKNQLVITKQEDDVSKKIVEAIPKKWRDKFSATQNEISILGNIEGIPVKCRVDAYDEPKKRIIDLKTTSMKLPKWENNIYESGYHTQIPWYTYLLLEAGKEVEDGFFFVIETSPPFGYMIFTIDDETVRYDAEHDINKAIEIYQRCHKSGDWSECYSTEIRTITRPYWEAKKRGLLNK